MSLAAVELAVAIFSSISVVLSVHDTGSIANVLESVGRKASIAAVVVEGLSAVNKLLFSKGFIAALAKNVPVCLKSTNSRECPA